MGKISDYLEEPDGPPNPHPVWSIVWRCAVYAVVVWACVAYGQHVYYEANHFPPPEYFQDYTYEHGEKIYFTWSVCSHEEVIYDTYPEYYFRTRFPCTFWTLTGIVLVSPYIIFGLRRGLRWTRNAFLFFLLCLGLAFGIKIIKDILDGD